jgi:vacuolar-type H+-ATPase subunit B/Vma2
LEVRDLISVVGEDGLNFEQKNILSFGEDFERTFLNQKADEHRDFNTTMRLAWEVLSNLNTNQLFRIHQNYIDKFYHSKV